MWAEWFRSLLIPAEASFPRSTQPEDAVGMPRLAGFGDASMTALCAVTYVIWTDKQGGHHPRVMTGKCRVAHLGGTTIPCGELQALVVLHRLILAITEAFRYHFPSISTYTDSLCSIGAVHKSTSALHPYFGNRVAELRLIREQLELVTDELAPISHILREDNLADLGTRGLVGIGDIRPGSTWQVGPKFLQSDYERWPRTSPSEVPDDEIPAEECRTMYVRSLSSPAEARDWPQSRIPNPGNDFQRRGGVTA